MALVRRAWLVSGMVAVLTGIGCSGARTYKNGINHCYLCAVKVARVNGYQVREQDFHASSGDLIAARSVPDPRETKVSRGFFRRFREVLWNLWEHTKLELWDEDLAGARVKTEERLTASFTTRRKGPLGWLGAKRPGETRIKVEMDVTDYGREDWVIARKDLKPADHERIYRQMAECLGSASPSAYLEAAKSAPPRLVAGQSPQQTPAEVSAPPSQEATIDTVATAPSSGTGQPPAEASAPPSQEAVQPSQQVPSQPVEGVPAAPPMSSEAALILLNSARTKYEAGKYDEAIKSLVRVTASDPENAEAWGYLGAAYYQGKRLDESIAAYEAYLELVPSDTRTQSFLEEIRKEKASQR